MATVLTLKGADFSARAVGYALPVQAGAEGWWWLGNGATASLKNFAYKGNASAVGTPTWGTGYASFVDMASYLETPVAETKSMTLMVVTRVPAALPAGTSAIWISNYGSGISGSGNGISLSRPGSQGTHPAGGYQLFWCTNSGSVVQESSLLSLSNEANWAFIAARVDADALTGKVQNLTAGTTSSIRSFPASRDTVVRPANFRIGSGRFGASGGPCDLAWAAMYSRSLDDSELTKIYQFVQNWLATKNSITV